MEKLNNKVVLVTGGSRGIGAAIVKQLAQEGATVVFTYVNSKSQAEALVGELGAKKFHSAAIQCDSRIGGAVSAAITQTINQYGPPGYPCQ